MRRCLFLALLALMFAVAVLASCGNKSSSSGSGADDDTALDDDASYCPNVSGDWVVRQMCEPALVGTDVGILQVYGNCQLIVATMAGNWSGEIDHAGFVTMSGPINTGNLNCHGPFDPSTNTMSMTCTGVGAACPFVMEGR